VRYVKDWLWHCDLYEHEGERLLKPAAMIGSAKLVKCLLRGSTPWDIQERDGKVAANTLKVTVPQKGLRDCHGVGRRLTRMLT
jgi:hypothetical protein